MMLPPLISPGFPSPTNSFIFNGDVVDRGPHGVATLLIVWILVLAFPGIVYMNRGNHEMSRMNERYKFADVPFKLILLNC